MPKPKPKTGDLSICGAKKRDGTPCRQKPMQGRTRCRLHGGVTTTIGNKSAATPGSIYSKFMTDDEQHIYKSMELGKVDDELRLLRIRLQRTLAEEHAAKEHADKASDKQDGQKAFLMLDTAVDRDGGGENTVWAERHYKAKDYNDIIRRTTARIESLERTRAELVRAQNGESDAAMSESLRMLAEKLPG